MANVKPITTLLAAMTPKEAPKAANESQVSFASVLGDASKDIAKTAPVSDSPEPPTLPTTNVAGKKEATTSGPIAQSKTPDLTSQPAVKEVVATAATESNAVPKVVTPQASKAKKATVTSDAKAVQPTTAKANVVATVADKAVIPASTTIPIGMPLVQSAPEEPSSLTEPRLNVAAPLAEKIPVQEDSLLSSSTEPSQTLTTVDSATTPVDLSASSISIPADLSSSDTTLPENLQSLLASIEKPTDAISADTAPTAKSGKSPKAIASTPKAASRKKTVGITKQSEDNKQLAGKISSASNSAKQNLSTTPDSAPVTTVAVTSVAPAIQTISATANVTTVPVSDQAVTTTTSVSSQANTSAPVTTAPAKATVTSADSSAASIGNLIAANPTIATSFAVVQNSAPSTTSPLTTTTAAPSATISNVDDFKASIGTPATATAVALVAPVTAKISAETTSQSATEPTEQPDPSIPVSRTIATAATSLTVATAKAPAPAKKSQSTTDKVVKNSTQATTDTVAPDDSDASKSEPSTSTAKEVTAQGTQLGSTGSSSILSAATTTKADKTTGTQPLTRQETLKVVQQITDRTQLLAATRPQNDVTIHLQPEGLGSVTAVVKTVGNVVDAAFSASNAHVRQALSDSKADLTQAMQKHGMSVATVSVSAQTDSSANGKSQQNPTFANSNTSNFNQSSSQGQQQQGSNTGNASRASFSSPIVSSTTSTPTARAATASGVDYLI